MFILNEDVVIRKDEDNSALLFSANTGEMFALNPTSVAIYEILEQKPTIEELLDKLASRIKLPENAKADIEEFLQQLIDKGFLTKSE